VTLKLYNHQSRAVELLRSTRRYGLWLSMGTGKTITLLSVCNERRIKTLVLCPRSVMRAAWLSDAEHFPGLNVKCLWHADRRKRLEFIKSPWDLGVLNYESFKIHVNDLLGVGVKRLIGDECFVAGTLVDTNSGSVPIEDVVIGDVVRNACGTGTVTGVFIRRQRRLVRVCVGGKTITCSENHLFLTSSGWVAASRIKNGTILVTQAESVRIVQNKTNRQNQGVALLRKILLGEMENESARVQATDIHKRKGHEDFSGVVKLLQVGESVCYSPDRKNTKDEPDRQPGCSEENIQSTEKKGMGSGVSWGEWNIAHCAGNNPAKKVGTGMGLEPSCFPWQENGWVSDQLQDRHCQSKNKTWGGGGRIFALQPEGSGYKERRHAPISRVDSVEILEQGHPEFDRLSGGEDTVACYDLSIDTHPSFSVHGFLVHNSSKIKSPTTAVTNAVIGFADKMDECYLMSGTPAPNHGAEYWPQLRCINPQWAGASFHRWAFRYFSPIQKKLRTGKTVTTGWRINPNTEQEFTEKLASCSWYLPKEACVDLPEKVDKVVEVQLSPAEAEAYVAAEKQLRVLTGDGESKMIKAEALMMKMRQITGGSVLVEGNPVLLGSAKIDAMMEVLDELGKRPAVVWAEFTNEIDRISDAVHASGRTVGYIDGRTSANAQWIVKNFQDGNLDVLICHPAAAGHGITLTRASTAIYYSLSFSSEQHLQSRDRIHRIGQKNQCTYVYLLAADTLDATVRRALLGKMTRGQAVLETLRERVGITGD
jgi:hypothetical protein